MMTSSEARRRAEIYNGRIVWNTHIGEYRVTLNEWTRREADKGEYFTDDLEDAVLTLAAMRASKDKADASPIHH